LRNKGAYIARKEATATKTASRKKGAPKAKKAAKKAKRAARKAAVPRESSKKRTVIEMLRAKGGATMAEIMKSTNWQAHSVRGFVSGTLTKKLDLKVESSCSDSGERTYKIAK
jgi:hypothetical protein